MSRITARIRASLRVLTVGIATTGAMALAVPPASAASLTTVQSTPQHVNAQQAAAVWDYVYYDNDNWGRIDVETTPVIVDVFDGQDDGSPVYADIDLENGDQYRQWDRSYDPYAQRHEYDYPVYRMRVCEYPGSHNSDYCSDWKYY